MQKEMTQEQYDQLRANFMTVMLNNEFGEYKVKLMQFGAVAALTAVFEQIPVGLSIAAMSGRTIIDTPKSDFKASGEYQLKRGHVKEIIDVDGEDARDAALAHLGYTLSKKPVQVYEED